VIDLVLELVLKLFTLGRSFALDLCILVLGFARELARFSLGLLYETRGRSSSSGVLELARFSLGLFYETRGRSSSSRILELGRLVSDRRLGRFLSLVTITRQRGYRVSTREERTTADSGSPFAWGDSCESWPMAVWAA
jgi:hypothetical protein